MGKTSELLSLLKTGNSDAARRLILKFKKSGERSMWGPWVLVDTWVGLLALV